MRGFGPGLVVFALLLTVAGLASTGALPGDRDAHRFYPLDIDGSRPVDLRGLGRIEVELGNERPGVRYVAYGRRPRLPEPPRIVRVDGMDRLELAADVPRVPGAIRVQLPASVEHVLIDAGLVGTEPGGAPAASLWIDADGDVDWFGDADRLVIRGLGGGMHCLQGEGRCPTLAVTGGVLEELRIVAPRGHVRINWTVRVPEILLYGRRDAGLEVAHIADLSRVRLLPLEQAPAPAEAAAAAEAAGPPPGD